MKTVLDAVNEFKGVWPYSHCESIIYCHTSTSMYNKGDYQSYVYDNFSNLNSNCFSSVCTLEEFNRCVKDCTNWFGNCSEVKPLYTKQIQEAGELPPVGSEAVCCYTNETHKIIAHDLFHEDGHYALVCDDTGYWGAEACRWSPIDTRTDKEKAIEDFNDGYNGLTVKASELALKLIIDGKIHGVTFTGSK